MRRKLAVIAAMAAAVAMSFALGGVAFADGGPHGGFGPSTVGGGGWASTDGCAGCHRAHTGANTYLLTDENITELCKNCHSGGVGAGTDVWAGQYKAGSDGIVGNGLNGGGFTQAVKYTGTTLSYNTFGNVTSTHDVGGTGTAWGGGVNGPGIAGKLECTSCHNPHGNDNYRMLTAGDITGAAPLEDGIVKAAPNELERTGQKNYTAGLDTYYNVGVSDFCASCHTNYLITRTLKVGQTYQWDPNGSPVDTWRHSVASVYRYTPSGTSWATSAGHDRTSSKLVESYEFHLRGAVEATATSFGPGQGAGGRGRITCLTCHFAHGSAASAGTNSADAGVVGGSALTFLDSRGVCQQCHGLSSN